jgi:glycerol kinase
MSKYLLSIDQGTTSSRAIVFDQLGNNVGQGQLEFKQYFPADGWVEHDPEEIWNSVLATCRLALKNANLSATDIASIGITNQRETTIIWDRASGKPIYNAIVWQDRRTAEYCRQLKNDSFETMVQDKTGLLIDPYFSGTKINWILDNIAGAREKANNNELAFGTIDSFLLWRLTDGKSHKTDATNASRTLLFNIHTQQWDEELLKMLNVPVSLLPTVEDSSAFFGETEAELFGSSIPITGIAGDQQAALFGQACFEAGMAKSTYGTGCFLMLNTGDQALKSKNRLLTTVAYRLNGKVTYAIEGSIFVAGAAIQWLRDGLKLVKDASESEAMAQRVGDDPGVYFVPAFTGLGAPYWDPDARGALLGITRDTTDEQVVTAGLQSVCYQTAELVEAMVGDSATADMQGSKTLRVDGGMVVNSWVVQFLSDIMNVKVDRAVVPETTALGVAYLAGLHVGIYSSLDEIASLWQRERRFEPSMNQAKREKLYNGWKKAVSRIRS